MDSDAFGVSFLFTVFGVAAKMYWTLLDSGKSVDRLSRLRRVGRFTATTEIRHTEPYRQLLDGDAPASDSILYSP